MKRILAMLLFALLLIGCFSSALAVSNKFQLAQNEIVEDDDNGSDDDSNDGGSTGSSSGGGGGSNGTKSKAVNEAPIPDDIHDIFPGIDFALRNDKPSWW